MGPGPHMYLPTDERKHVVIDKTNGRGLFEMFISKESGFIRRISPAEVESALEGIT